MLLAIDIGNSNVTLGAWDGRQWRRQWRLRTEAARTGDEYGVVVRSLLDQANVTAVSEVIVGSVVPALTTTFTAVARHFLDCEAWHVDAQTPTGITLNVDRPAEVGPDRIANAVAAAALYPGGAIVIDMGTATTFDVVGPDHSLEGVVIAPGLEVTAGALFERAARLMPVPLEAPPHALGKNTVQAVQAGLIFGYVGLIEGVVARLSAEMTAPPRHVVGTGGLVERIAQHTEVITAVDPWLTLTGLRLIAERLGANS